jgi:hypothetical protein
VSATVISGSRLTDFGAKANRSEVMRASALERRGTNAGGLLARHRRSGGDWKPLPEHGPDVKGYIAGPRYHAIHNRLRNAVGYLNLLAFRSQFHFLDALPQQLLLLDRLAMRKEPPDLFPISHHHSNVNLRRPRGRRSVLPRPLAFRSQFV